jgi:Arc/MetJ-type ribon-helix-helix transcriptional regulator
MNLPQTKYWQVELPDEMAREVENAVETGTFENATEVVRASLREFISRRRFELMEQQQLQDIAWALREKSATK